MAKRHWLMLALVVSVAINLVAAGALFARWSLGGHRVPMIWALSDLDDPVRAEVRSILQRSFRDTRATRDDLRSASDRLRRVLAQASVDPTELADALTAMQAATNGYQQQMHIVALEVLPQLDREQRMRVAARLLRPGPPRGPDDGRGPGHDHHRPREAPTLGPDANP